jgi:hypothetical protein
MGGVSLVEIELAVLPPELPVHRARRAEEFLTGVITPRRI